jgi:hypothetical protein
MSNGTLSKEDEEKAEELYSRFWKQYPDIPNPTDINTKEKHNFCKTITYEELSLMQRARKQAYTFTNLSQKKSMSICNIIK